MTNAPRTPRTADHTLGALNFLTTDRIVHPVAQEADMTTTTSKRAPRKSPVKGSAARMTAAAKANTAKKLPARTAEMAPPAGKTYTVAAVAEMLAINPRALRAYLRSTARTVGKGTRYGFTPAEAKRIVTEYRKAHKG